MSPVKAPPSFEVELPAGGMLMLHSADEVELWNRTRDQYVADYALTAQNDLVHIGAILMQTITLHRAMKRLNGEEVEFDDGGNPTGRYNRFELKPTDARRNQEIVQEASKELREIEKGLGLDKKTREAGGGMDVAGYVKALKTASRNYGIHLVKRTQLYEDVMMEARWKLRLLKNGDAEDRAYHHLTADTFCDWLRDELAAIEEHDKAFAKEKGRVFAGQL